MTESTKIPLRSLKKEATLLFLAIFYFVIATNTQTGWLFVLSAFLLGLLVLSWSLSRRSIGKLSLTAKIHGEPQRGRPFRLLLTLENANQRAVHEARVELDRPGWAETEKPMHWAVPRLAANSHTQMAFNLTPVRRGEHVLPPVKIICGAPFGLFTVVKTITLDRTFLVFPELEKLPLLKSRSRAATTLGDLTSPRGLGDTHSLRSVREYKAGDDLRQVHWKASAKRGPGMPLLVREHHAPAPNRVLLFLDTSAPEDIPEFHQPFERAVVLAASILWSAARDGTQAGLALRDNSGRWEVLCHWPQQYRALARIELASRLSFDEWSKAAEQIFQEGLPRGFQSSSATLVKGALEAQRVVTWPGWVHKILLLQAPDSPSDLPTDPRLTTFDCTKEGFHHV